MMRPSTAARLARLTRLRAVLAARALPQAGIADVLDCSASAARNYVGALLAAGVVESVPHGRVNGRTYKSLYRLRRDAQAPVAPRDPLVSALFGRGGVA